MSNADIRGRFIWHELMTTDPGAAGSFYSKVLPWKTQPSGMPDYTLWVSGKTQAGGLMALPAESQSAPPHWLLYIGTPNVDSTAQDIQRLGGRILKSPADIPNVGRFAVAADPQGAAFAVYTPASAGDGPPPQGTVGGFSWHELATSDPDAATSFYIELFGWTKDAVHDMGPMGAYTLLAHGGKQVGGVFKARDGATPPNWLSYVQVADAGKAANAAKGAGGRVLNGPMEVPGGSWIAQLMDPQGGAFAVVEAPRTAKPAAEAKPAAAPKAKPAAAAAPNAKPASAKPSAPAAASTAPAKKAAAKKAAPKPAKAAKKVAKKAAKGARKAAKKAAGKSSARKAAAKKAPKKAPKKKAAGKRATKRGAAKKAARKK
jgi:predicted enzyme related to lactoylglutathione lyase